MMLDVLYVLRGGIETQGWLSLKVSWIDDLLKRRPVSYTHCFLACSHRPHFGCAPSPKQTVQRELIVCCLRSYIDSGASDSGCCFGQTTVTALQ